ncbi:MAG: hypothetical protein ACLT3Y_04595 [Ruminococcus callidus]
MRKITDANRVTTETITTAKTYGTQAVYEDDDTYNNYGSYDDDTDNSYQPAVTTRAYTTIIPATQQTPIHYSGSDTAAGYICSCCYTGTSSYCGTFCSGRNDSGSR